MQTLETTVKTVKLNKAQFLLFRGMEKVQERTKRAIDALDKWKDGVKAKYSTDTVFTFKPSGESEQKVASIKEQPGRAQIDLAKLETEFPGAFHACVAPGKPVRVFRWH